MKRPKLVWVIAGCFVLAVFGFALLRDRSTANEPSDSAQTTPHPPEQTTKGDSETPPIAPSNPSADKSDGRFKNPRAQDVEGFYQDALKSKGVDEVKYVKILDVLNGLLSDPDYRDLFELNDIRKQVHDEIQRERARLGENQFNAYLAVSDYTQPAVEEHTQLLEHYLRNGIKHFNDTRFDQALKTFHEFELLVQQLVGDKMFMKAIEPMIETEALYVRQARQIVAEREAKEAEERKKLWGEQRSHTRKIVVIEYIDDPVKRRLDAIARLEGPQQDEWWSAAERLGEFVVAGYTDAIQTALRKISTSDEDIRYSLLYHLLLSYDDAVFKEALHQSFSNLSTANKFKCLDALYRLNHLEVLLREFQPAPDLKQADVESTIKRKRATAAAFLKDQLKTEKEETLQNKIQTILSSLED